MLLTEERLRSYATYQRRSLAQNRLKSFRYQANSSVFLSHSHKDKELVERVRVALGSQGIDVYIDWQDGEMPSRPNRATAKRIKDKIKENHLFLLLLTSNSIDSRWVPWELGIADQAKRLEQILVFVVRPSTMTDFGSEYLQLYHHVRDIYGNLRVAAPGQETSQVELREFLRKAAY